MTTTEAAVLVQFGDADSFALREVRLPPLRSRQIRVAVHATSVNPLDYQIRRGDYRDLVELPAVIGHDVSGVVAAVGDEVHELTVGDEVYYTPKIFGPMGSYTRDHVVDVDLVGRKPKNLSHLEAASLTLVGGTVWEALVGRAALRLGESILIHGGAGGVGTIAIQIARAMGVRVLTTARERDHAFVKELGADVAIDFATSDYVAEVAAASDGKGVDVVLDTIGGDVLTRSPLVLADMGRVVTLVDISKPQNLIEAWGRNAAYHFVFTRQNRGKLDALTSLVERGVVKPVIGKTLPLADISEAHRLLEDRSRLALRGKVAIAVRDGGEGTAVDDAA